MANKSAMAEDMAAGLRPGSMALNGAVLPLLAAAIFINYADRGNLATAVPLLKSELHLSGTQIGVLLSAFFWIYVPAQILAGWLVHRIGAYRTLAIGLAVWSVATAATGVADGFAALLGLRLLLGLGESAAFPSMGKLLAQHVPAHRLGAANGLVGMGLGLGPAFGTFAGGMLMAYFGWRNLFLLFGVLSGLWLVPWWFATHRLSAHARAYAAHDTSSFAAVLRRREAWATNLAHFCGLYAFYFVISWLPLYLVKERGLSVPHMAQTGGLIYLVYAASILITGVVSDRLIANGYSVTVIRKSGAVGGLAIAAASLLITAFAGAALAVASLYVAGIAFGLVSANVYTIPQILAGPQAAGRWVAVQNCVGNCGGIIAPIVTGFVIDRTGVFFWAFVVAAAMAALGMLFWGLMLGPVRPLKWTAEAP